MKPMQITFEIDSPERLASFTQWYNGYAPAPQQTSAGKLKSADNPEVGQDMSSDAAMVFTQAPALSTVGAGQSSTAQGANADTSQKMDAAQTFAAQTGSQGATAAAPAPTGLPVQIETDSSGLPWDGRIHAATKTKKVDGTWKAKKGADAAVIAQVEAELRQAMSVPFTPLNQAAPPPPPPTQQAPAADSAPSGDAPVTDFVSLCRYVTARKIPAARILEVCNRYGLAGLGLAATRFDLIPALAADFQTGA